MRKAIISITVVTLIASILSTWIMVFVDVNTPTIDPTITVSAE